MALGMGYGLMGVALVLFGFVRRREVDEAVSDGARYAAPHNRVLSAFPFGAGLLGLGTVAFVALA